MGAAARGGVTAERAAGAASAADVEAPFAAADCCDVAAGGCADGCAPGCGFDAVTDEAAAAIGGSAARFGGASTGVCRAVGMGAFGLNVVVARWSDAGAPRAVGRCVGR